MRVEHVEYVPVPLDIERDAAFDDEPVGWLNTPELERVIITINPADWGDLGAQFTEPLCLFAGARCTVAVMADEWEDIQAQFPEARLAE